MYMYYVQYLGSIRMYVQYPTSEGGTYTGTYTATPNEKIKIPTFPRLFPHQPSSLYDAVDLTQPAT